MDRQTGSRKIKLDLHTHPIEALRAEFGIKDIRDINQEVAARIVKAVKSAGLDGIAITEHNNFNHSWVAALEILKNFPGERLTVLPGEEIDYNGQQFLRIFIPDYIRKRISFFKQKEWVLIFAHPGCHNPCDLAQFNDIEFDAVEEMSQHGQFKLADEISHARSIPKIRASDAHKLENIGLYHTELDFIPTKRSARF